MAMFISSFSSFFLEVCSFVIKTLDCIFNKKLFQLKKVYNFAYVVLCIKSLFLLVFLC